jgi:hypothetical protein
LEPIKSRCAWFINDLYQPQHDKVRAEPYGGLVMSKILQTLQGTIIAGIVITVVIDLIVRYTF